MSRPQVYYFFDPHNDRVQIRFENRCFWVFRDVGRRAWLGIASGKVQSRTISKEIKRLKEKYKLSEEPQ